MPHEADGHSVAARAAGGAPGGRATLLTCAQVYFVPVWALLP
jgi:hypothetical protein